MIVVSIIGILTAIATPNYRTHVTHAKRMEAEMTLMQIASQLESFALAHQTYEGATLHNMGFPNHVAQGQYQLQLNTHEDFFEIVAAPTPNQAERDKDCGLLSLNARNEKRPYGENCWN